MKEFVEALATQVETIHSVMVVRHGHVISEVWWDPHSAETPHVLHSLSKSFTSTAVGLACAEGKLDIDDKVISFFPDDLPEHPSDNLEAMRVRDLLTMSTGHEREPRPTDMESGSWIKFFLAADVPREPGTHFVYNSPATYMLSAIVQKVTGSTVLDYLGPRLFEPLGITNPRWGTSPEGVTFGGWGLWLCTEDVAKFGQLMLQKGRWNGEQLVPADWIQQATCKQVSNGTDPDSDWSQGYGFQFWQCRQNAYRGDGANGQFCIVIPEHDIVVAMTAETKDMQSELNLVWKFLLPAIRTRNAAPVLVESGAP
jgi:CubicO group peptidase (beta-lactamase class C family)